MIQFAAFFSKIFIDSVYLKLSKANIECIDSKSSNLLLNCEVSVFNSNKIRYGVSRFITS